MIQGWHDDFDCGVAFNAVVRRDDRVGIDTRRRAGLEKTTAVDRAPAAIHAPSIRKAVDRILVGIIPLGHELLCTVRGYYNRIRGYRDMVERAGKGIDNIGRTAENRHIYHRLLNDPALFAEHVKHRRHIRFTG